MQLALAVVSQPGFHFTDLTPSKVVEGSLRFLKFKLMDTRATVLPNLPWWDARVKVVTAPHAIEDALAPEDVKAYRDHSHFPWLNHVAVGREGAYCYVIYKKGTLKHLPSCVILYVSHADLFFRYRFAFGSHLLFRHGMASIRIESRLLQRRSWLSVQVIGSENKMFRSDTLNEFDISNTYSELMALDL